jgi:hypothetical protein
VTEPKKYWFPTKRYGWGWGLPARWEGWAAMAVFVLAVLGGFAVPPLFLDRTAALVVGYVVGLLAVGAFLVVCHRFGEPPRWRWGDRDDDGG